MANKPDVILKKLFKFFEEQVYHVKDKENEVLFGIIRFDAKDVLGKEVRACESVDMVLRIAMSRIHRESTKPNMATDMLKARALTEAPNGMSKLQGLQSAEAKDVWVDTTTYRMAEYIDSTLTWQYTDSSFMVFAYSWNPLTYNPADKSTASITTKMVQSMTREVLETNTIHIRHD